MTDILSKLQEPLTMGKFASKDDLLTEALEQRAEAKAVISYLQVVLLECMSEIDSYIWQEYPHDHPVHESRRQRDFASNPARVALLKLNLEES